VKPIGAHLRTTLDALRRVAPTEEEVAARERADRDEARIARGNAYRDALEKVIPVGLRHAVRTPPDPYPGNRVAIALATGLQPGRSMFLHGPPGVGKTHLAVYTAARLVADHGLKAHVWEWPELLRRARDFRATERMPNIGEADVLVVDDFDKGAVTEFVYERAYEVLQRVLAGRTTIVTANRSPANTAIRFGLGDEENTAALISRFHAFDSAVVSGRDHRVADRRGL